MAKPDYTYSKLEKESDVPDIDPAEGSFFRHADPEKGTDVDDGPAKSKMSRAAAVVKFIAILLFVNWMLLPHVSSPPCRKSRSAEDRAHKILSKTPLIGEITLPTTAHMPT